MNNVELEKHLEELSESNPFLEVKCVNSETKKKIEIDYRPPASSGSGISGSFLDKLLGEKPLTLIEHVNNQLGLQVLSPKQEQIAQRLLMDLTAAGYLQTDINEIQNQLSVSKSDIEDVVAIMQAFEPTGVFARISVVYRSFRVREFLDSMKFAVLSCLLAVAAVGNANAAEVTPIEKVLQMLSDLEAKIIGEGSDAQKVYEEFSEFCEDRSRELGFEIKTGKGEVKELEAEIEHQSSVIDSLNAKIEELAQDISVDEADLKAATEIRTKEKLEFEVEEKELLDVISTLERAIGIIEKEMNSGASMMQLQRASSAVQALSIMVQATSISSADAEKLTSLLQNSAESEEPGAPAAAVFKSSSGGIVETLTDLLDKAEGQLDEARKTETKNIQAYEMLASSLKDEIKYATKDMDKAKKDLGAAEEAKATAEGDLAVTSKDLAEDIESLATLHSDCMKGAEDFEAETKSRAEELKALATAKKVITETTAGAAEQSYGLNQVSLLQVSSGAELANFEAVRLVRDLARQHKSTMLAQLAIKMGQAMSSGGRAGDQNPFAKVEGLIRDMIAKLLAEAEADATEKAFCDKAMAETEEKKADKEAAIEKLSTAIDSMSAKSTKLKDEVAVLQKELAELAKTQAEMDKLRAEEKAAFDTSSAEMKQGLDGVKLALKVLNEYYAKDAKADTDYKAAEGAGSGIIGLLEVVESDFSKGLAEMISAEETAVADYDQMTKENEITKATKDQDVKYKTQEFKGLDKSIAEATSDRATVQTELDAVMDYYKSIKERCVAKAEAYSERVKRRDAEIAGLKEALSILNGEAVLLQQSRGKRTLRGHA
jgi:chromosome segregation ATPase